MMLDVPGELTDAQRLCQRFVRQRFTTWRFRVEAWRQEPTEDGRLLVTAECLDTETDTRQEMSLPAEATRDSLDFVRWLLANTLVADWAAEIAGTRQPVDCGL